ncbi:unnamed protein product [Rhodiola kirilowii]
MPSKLRKAIGAMKDTTSISLAKVSNKRTSLDIAILKATTHVETPIEERYMNEILEYIKSNKNYSSSCAHTIARRIGKTRNWVVALKSLMLVLRIFQDGDPYFPREVLHTMKRGAKILSLVNFRDDSNSSPWEYTLFVRTFSLYLDERLHCFLTGKLQKKFDFRERRNGVKHKSSSRQCKFENVRDMKPAMLVDKISDWQKLLDRAMGTKPTGAAQTNSLIQNAFYAVLQESFDLYHDISEGLTFLLDSFFHLQYQSCVSAFQICIKASKQLVDLHEFYDLCKSIGVGRTSEYPSVQKISDELIQTLQEFLKDQSSFQERSSSNQLAVAGQAAGARDVGSTSERIESYQHSEVSELTERYSDVGSRTTSLEDFFSATETGASPSPSADFYLDRSNRQSQQSLSGLSNGGSEAGPSQSTQKKAANSSSLSLFEDWPEVLPCEESSKDSGHSTAHVDKTNTTLNLFDDWHEVGIHNLNLNSTESSKDGWELALLETAKQPIETANAPPFLDSLFDQASVPEPYNNPFLQDADESSFPIDPSTTNALMLFPNTDSTSPSAQNSMSLFLGSDMFPLTPTFQNTPAPTFRATDTASGHDQDDPFGYNDPFGDGFTAGAAVTNDQLVVVNPENVLQQQKLWLEHQNKIIAKHVTLG